MKKFIIFICIIILIIQYANYSKIQSSKTIMPNFKSIPNIKTPVSPPSKKPPMYIVDDNNLNFKS